MITTMANDTELTKRIADDLRTQIRNGTLEPGDPLPSARELAIQWHCSDKPPRAALEKLLAEGLTTSQPGRPFVVRSQPCRVIRDSDRHQAEKDLVLTGEHVRGVHGEAEDDLRMSLDEVLPSVRYDTIPADEDLAAALSVEPGTKLLRRRYEKRSKPNRQRPAGTRLTCSTSYIPRKLLEPNPVLLKANCEPWPGGTMHQFHTVGIEIANVVDDVTAHMPDSDETEEWDLEPGVPMLAVRRISYDTEGRVVEVSDAVYPADRTLLRHRTQLRPLAGV
jgi:GntR family transcriptional regulator